MKPFIIIPKTNDRLTLDNFIKDYQQYIWDNRIIIPEEHIVSTECLNALYNIIKGV